MNLPHDQLAHLSLWRTGVLKVWKGSVVVVCLATFSNILYSETSGPIEIKFHVEPPSDGEMKICSNSPSHMTKTVAMTV